MPRIVLFQPEIPPNTGNVARTSAATGSELHLIEPLGFFWDDRQLKRAGLDYWELVNIKRHLNFESYLAEFPEKRPFYLTTKSSHSYAEAVYHENDALVFGPETRGLPAAILARDPERTIRIPMRPDARSLNLANSVAVVLYEALRQQGFPILK
jgi:tRNA (cytidine/uridine-2'-O-)-methyltransferase